MDANTVFLKWAGFAQVVGYTIDLNAAAQDGLLTGNHPEHGHYNWNQTTFRFGTREGWPGKYRQHPFKPFPVVDLVADYVGMGVVVHWFEPNENAALLTAVEIAAIVSNKKLLRRRGFTPRSLPEPEYEPAYAIDFQTVCKGVVIVSLGSVVIVATLLEDGTGLGVVDDIITVPGGILLINYGLKLATFSPYP